MKFDRGARIHDLLATPSARAVVERAVPGLLTTPGLEEGRMLPLRRLFATGAVEAAGPETVERLWDELARIDVAVPTRTGAPAVEPRADYEDADVSEGSAPVTLPESATVWAPLEVVIAGPSHGNPFVDVELTATVSLGDSDVTVGGFYDGDGRWIVRYLPETPGRLRFRTSSTARSLHGLTGEIEVAGAEPGAHGPVRAGGYHFVHADGTRHTPLGTTAYAWIHQPADLREATLRTLSGGPFTKLRMTVFPKAMVYNNDDPERFPFPGGPEEGFDHTRFDVTFFRHLDDSVRRLGELGIEADIILFHPYDRWGFADLGAATDERYAAYVVRRLWAYPNVWWSMANEYDFVLEKTVEDWDRLAAVVVRNDPAGHLLSIHNGYTVYDHTRDWITHASLQRTDPYRLAENTGDWRRRWRKPVIIDELGYEGDLEFEWGNTSAVELVHQFWEGAARGGYVGHGETYHRDDEQIWWAKGGVLTGDSPARIAFLRRVIADAPGGILEPVERIADGCAAGVPGRYYLLYFGLHRPSFVSPRLPSGRYRVELIDTWEMTIDRLADIDAGDRIDLPAREYQALRITAL